MNFIKVIGLLGLLNISTCASTNNNNQSGSDKNVKMIELTLYVDAAIQLSFADGVFESKIQQHADALNRLISGKQVSVRKLGGKKVISKTDTIFYLTVDEKHSEKLVEDLQELSFVNGAFIKPEAEEPGEGFP